MVTIFEKDFKDLVDQDDALLANCCYIDISDNNLDIPVSQNSIKIAHLNIHSIPSKYEDLLDLLGMLKEKNLLPDMILLCETFLNDKNFNSIHFPNYNIISQHRKTKTQGGVAIMIGTHVRYHERGDLNIFDEGAFESIFIEVPRENKPSYVIGEIYRVPGTNENEFLTKYESIITKIRAENKKIIIGTDQNLDYLKIDVHNNTKKLFELNLQNHLLPSITKPTRVTHSTATLIDNIYVDTELFTFLQSFVVKTDISDHFLCLVDIQNNSFSKTDVGGYTFRKIDENSTRNIKGALYNIDWSLLEQMSTNEASLFLSKEITKALDFYAPIKISKGRQKHKSREPWFTLGLKTSSMRCFKMYREVCHLAHDSVKFVRYKEYRKQYNKLRRQAKHKYYNELIANNRYNTKKLWNILNKLIGKLNNKQSICEEIVMNGVKETNKLKISNAFGEYYSEIGKKIVENINKNVTQNNVYNAAQRNLASCFLHPTNNREIEKIILKLKSKNSKGYDGLSNTLLKSIYLSILPALNIIFNKSLSKGEFPDNMKLALVKPLYKAKSRSDMNNYRPISLLPVISKVLEKLVHIRVMKFFNRHKVLYEGQYGFRSGRSTSDAILDLTGNILDGYNKGMYTLGLFLDMTKAFDCINHQILFRKLELYGIRGIALDWFKSYLGKRSLKVALGNVLSEEFPVSCGTPQGSVLGPLLYIIIANDMPKCLKFANSIMFADDTTIFMSGRNLKFLYRKMNDDLNRLTLWFNKNNLSLNIGKSYAVLFKTRTKLANYQGNITIDGVNVKQVPSVKFLGVHIDQHLDWNTHCQYLLTKLAMGNYSLSMTKNMLPYFSKKIVYQTNVESHLSYGISAWGPMANGSILRKLIVKQNTAIRAISNIKRRVRILPYYKKGKLLKLEDMIEKSLLNLSYRYINDTLPQRIVNLYEFINHQHNTRNNNNLRTPHHNLQIYNKSFLAKAPQLWQNLPQNMKDKPTIKSFNKYITKWKVENY